MNIKLPLGDYYSTEFIITHQEEIAEELKDLENPYLPLLESSE